MSGLVPSPPYLFVGTYDGVMRAFLSERSIPPEPPPQREGGCRIGAGSTSAGTLFALLLVVFFSRFVLRR